MRQISERLESSSVAPLRRWSALALPLAAADWPSRFVPSDFGFVVLIDDLFGFA
jgi:hypothetical protein